MGRQTRTIAHLPERPRRPHPYFELEGLDVDVPLSGRDAPVRVHCKVAGSGPPLLLVHGLMTSSYSFRYVIAPLAERYRVVVPDLPGAGQSDAPVDLEMFPERVAALLRGLMAALELEPVYLVGNSLGGYLSLWAALDAGPAVRRLMIMHAPGFPEARVRALRTALALPGSSWLFSRLVRDPERFVYRNVHYHDDSLKSLEEVRHYGAIFRDEARTAVFLRILRESLAPSRMRALHRRLAALRQGPSRDDSALPPIRLLWARQDVMVPPAFGPRYEAALPGAELVWLDQTSHFMQVDSPERTVAEILRFDDE